MSLKCIPAVCVSVGLFVSQAMEIFELMEDTDKVIQVLINLANLAELQLDDPKEALEYRLVTAV